MQDAGKDETMKYRRLGKTECMVSEVGFGGEWLERHNTEECVQLIRSAEAEGINILDCWMSNPVVRSNIGKGIAGHREKWFIQGHIGSTWQEGQYVRSREIGIVREAFEDLLMRLGTDYIDFGMIHYIDEEKEWEAIQSSEFLDYVFALKKKGTIRHIGLSTHNPLIAQKAAVCGYVEMILFSINPAFDFMPPTENIDDLFAEKFDEGLVGRIEPEREKFYQLAQAQDVGITVMKPYAGGRLLNAGQSPFGTALTPVQCIHYALTRPAVGSVLCGYDNLEHVAQAVAYENATEEEKDYASVLAKAPQHAFRGQCTYCGHCKPCPVNIDIALVGKFYDLALMQPEIPDSIRDHYHVMEAHASDCIGCGGCESRCPFGVRVTERMRDCAKLFGE